ncbi:PP2C family protein-serine/threonine phosphatase [Luteitalea sp. TBR-22]|uniref:PP2C family protein-serine/threonine phosphatase n=1 Tax=Luteitalea sp. TBR-22 TaxID=2802971 RepID=UPI001EF461FF|nr:PP2C family protein-serine/threonine phosphatase [Luteitalea sp. TBR-22]
MRQTHQPRAGEIAEPLSASAPVRLAHGETWARAGRASGLVQLPGLEAWVHSQPAAQGECGGDVQVLSVCPVGQVARIALADVSGHGNAVAAFGAILRDMVQDSLSALEQRSLLRELNRAVGARLASLHYVTMVAAGWHSHRAVLVLSSAGHPPSLWYRADAGQWRWLESRRTTSRRATGLPLGLLPDVSYGSRALHLGPGDIVLLYSDGVSEALDSRGEELGRPGLLTLARALDVRSAEAFGLALAASLERYRGDAAAVDDVSFVVLKRPDGPIPSSDGTRGAGLL